MTLQLSFFLNLFKLRIGVKSYIYYNNLDVTNIYAAEIISKIMLKMKVFTYQQTLEPNTVY